MNRKRCIALAAAFLLADFALGGFILTTKASEPHPQEEKIVIIDKICKLDKETFCTHACGETGDERQCHNDCVVTLGNACRSASKSGDVPHQVKKKGIFCGLTTRIVCLLACSGTGVERKCWDECHDIVVDSCP